MTLMKNNEVIECVMFRCPEGHTHIEFSDGGEVVFVMVLDDDEVDVFLEKLTKARNPNRGH